VRRVVAWPEVPPPSAAEDLWPPARVLGDGTSLWVQHGAGAPVVRVDLDGTAVAAWPDGAWLAACGPTGAWCTSPPPEQVLVRDGDPLDLGLLPDRLLHVAPDGTVTVVATDRPVRSVRATPDALEVRLDDEPATLHELGAGTSEVEPSQRVLRLLWQEPLPASVTVADAAPPVGPDEVDDEHDATADGGRWHAPWCDLDEPGCRRWGWSGTSAGTSTRTSTGTADRSSASTGSTGGASRSPAVSTGRGPAPRSRAGTSAADGWWPRRRPEDGWPSRSTGAPGDPRRPPRLRSRWSRWTRTAVG
jgi:hypothetical protein